MSLYPAGRALSSPKSNNNGGLYRFFWSGGGRSFLEIEDKKGIHSTRSAGVVWVLHAVVVVPMAAKGFSCVSLDEVRVRARVSSRQAAPTFVSCCAPQCGH